jgi:hypothetical protein
MLNVAQMSKAIGCRVLVTFGSVKVYCTVRDVRKVWNRVDLLVSPDAGEGSEWVSMSRLNYPKNSDGASMFSDALVTV